MNYEFDEDYLGDGQETLNAEALYSLFKGHPEIVDLELSQINTEALGYIAHFCTGLKKLKSSCRPTRVEFKLGFQNLEMLDLALSAGYLGSHSAKDASKLYLTLQNITALPNLKCLRLDADRVPNVQSKNLMSKMQSLESLELPFGCLSRSLQAELIISCGRILSNIYIDSIEDADLHTLLENCPRLTSIGFECHEISHDGFAALFRKLGKQLEYLHIMDANFNDVDLKELMNSQPTKLRALDLGFDQEIQVTSEVAIEFIKKYGGQLKRLTLIRCGALNDAVLSAITEHCPQGSKT